LTRNKKQFPIRRRRKGCDEKEDDEDEEDTNTLCVLRRFRLRGWREKGLRAMRLAWCRWRQRDVVCNARARRRRERNGQVTENARVNLMTFFLTSRSLVTRFYAPQSQSQSPLKMRSCPRE